MARVGGRLLRQATTRSRPAPGRTRADGDPAPPYFVKLEGNHRHTETGKPGGPGSSPTPRRSRRGAGTRPGHGAGGAHPQPAARPRPSGRKNRVPTRPRRGQRRGCGNAYPVLRRPRKCARPGAAARGARRPAGPRPAPRPAPPSFHRLRGPRRGGAPRPVTAAQRLRAGGDSGVRLPPGLRASFRAPGPGGGPRRLLCPGARSEYWPGTGRRTSSAPQVAGAGGRYRAS